MNEDRSTAECGNALLLTIALLVAIAALALSLFSIARAVRPAESVPVTRSDFNTTGTLKVAVVPAPPITAFDPTSKNPNGYAVDVVNTIARNAKLKIEYLPVDWGTMGAALASGKVDLVIGPIFMTEGRAREFAFSDALFAYAIVVVVPKSSQKVRNLDDLRQPGIRIAVGRGGFDAEFVSRNLPAAKISTFPPDDPNLSMLEVAAGRTDAALVDFATAKRFVAEHSETALIEAPPVSLQYAAFMLRREDGALRDFLNVALRNLDLSGELSSIDSRYSTQQAWYGRVSYRPTIVR